MSSHAISALRGATPLRKLALSRWACAALCAASASAFADCTSRKERPQETDFNARALALLASALPPAPAGVVARDEKPFDFKKPPAIYDVLCEGSKEGAFSVTVRRHYLRKHSDAERRQADAQYEALMSQIQALRKVPADKLAEEQALRQKSNAAWQAARDAEKAGDKAGAEARNNEYRATRDQADAIETQHRVSVKPQTDELERRRKSIDLTEQRVEILLGMNLQRLPVAGERAVVGGAGAASPGQSAGLKVNNVAWSVVGLDGSLRQALAASIDTERLKATVGKAPPSAPESEAFAAQAKPAVVPEMAPGAASADAAPSKPALATATAAPSRAGNERAAAAPIAASAPAEASAGEPVKKAAEAINKLRGLLGR